MYLAYEPQWRSEVGKQTFLKSPQIANPLIPLLQIRKFIRCANPQIANLQNFMINSQIAKRSSPSQIRKVPRLRKVRKSNKLFKSANLRNLFANRPPLVKVLWKSTPKSHALDSPRLTRHQHALPCLGDPIWWLPSRYWIFSFMGGGGGGWPLWKRSLSPQFY